MDAVRKWLLAGSGSAATLPALLSSRSLRWLLNGDGARCSETEEAAVAARLPRALVACWCSTRRHARGAAAKWRGAARPHIR